MRLIRRFWIWHDKLAADVRSYLLSSLRTSALVCEIGRCLLKLEGRDCTVSSFCWPRVVRAVFDRQSSALDLMAAIPREKQKEVI